MVGYHIVVSVFEAENWKKEEGFFFSDSLHRVIALYHHNYHMYTVQLSLFQVFPTVIIQTCGSIFCRTFRHLLHYATLFHSTKTMHALASQFASLLGCIWPCSYLFVKEEMKEKKENMPFSGIYMRAYAWILTDMK